MRRLSQLGGKATIAKLTPARRSALVRKAGKASGAATAQWHAAGLVAQRRMAESTETAFPSLDQIDWAKQERLAPKWTGRGALEQRANRAGCRQLYRLRYRHGSSFEHSDAWSVLSFDRENRWAVEVIANLTLVTTLYAAHKIAAAYIAFFAVNRRDKIAAIEAQFKTAFPKAWAKATDESVDAERPS